MQILWQHWVLFLIVLAVGMWIGRKTDLLRGLPVIG